MRTNRTPQDFLDELAAKDMSVAQWCRDHRVTTTTVWSVIKGTVLGRRGQARRARRLMGLPLPSTKVDRTPRPKPERVPYPMPGKSDTTNP